MGCGWRGGDEGTVGMHQVGREGSPRDGRPAARWVLPRYPAGVGGAPCVSRRSAAAMLQGTSCGGVTCVSG